MTLKTILTTLIIGASSVAAADPIVRDHRTAPEYDSRYYDNDGFDDRFERDDRFDRDDRDHRRARMRRPILLANDVALVGTNRPSYVALDGRERRIGKLRLDANSGRTYVDSVLVMFADGHRQTISVRQTLSRRDPSVTVDLPHHGVTGIYIYGSQLARANRFDGGPVGFAQRGTIDVIGLRR